MTEQQAELITTRPGARLRHERESRKLTVEQVSARTRIRERVILAIEKDDTDWIAPVYLRGYVKAYASCLGLDAADFESDARATAGSDPELRPVFGISRKRGFAERWLKAGSYLVATALIAALVWQVTQQAVQFSQGRTTFVGTENENGDPARPTSVDGKTEVAAPRKSSHLAASIASLERMQKRPANTESAAEQAWSAINEPIEVEPQTPLSGAAVIRISVSADSWVEIIDSTGKQLEKDLLRGGNERSYQGSPPFDLMLGRASAVVVEFQGEAVDIAPHIRGDVARLTLGAAEPQNP